MTAISTLPELLTEMNDLVSRCTSERDRISGTVDILSRFLPHAMDTELGTLPPGDQKYSRHLVHADPDDRYSLLALIWRPGQGTPIHDHPSWGVLGVVSGRMKFVNYGEQVVDGQRCLMPIETFIGSAGSVGTVFPPHVDVHRMANADRDEIAISLHCYGCEVKEFSIYNAETAECRPGTSVYDSRLEVAVAR